MIINGRAPADERLLVFSEELTKYDFGPTIRWHPDGSRTPFRWPASSG